MNATLAETRPCRSCGVDIYLLMNVDTGRWMPVDQTPTSGGNVNVDVYRRTCQVLAGDLLAKARALGSELHQPHHQTCPDADRHRRPPSRQQAPLFDPEELT